MDKATKFKVKEELADRLKKSKMLVLTEYRGLTVAELTELRNKLREVNSEIKVTKNRIFKRSIEEDAPEYSEIVNELKGPTATVFSYGDIVQTTKTLLDFRKEHELLVLRGGVLEGKRVGEEDLKAIADLPSKEELLSQIVGSIIAPHRGLVTCLSGVARNLVQVINAIKEKKASEQGS